MARGRTGPGRTDAPDDDDEGDGTRLRLDKWLWAARFFKTRSLAADAIDGGKVQVNGERAKRSREVQPGDEVRLRSGAFETVLHVKAISARRGSATIAQALYEETPESRAAREKTAAQLRSMATSFSHDQGRPTRQERKQYDRWRGRGEE